MKTMSTIDDVPTYPFSKRLVTVIKEVMPHASARPARAKHFERLHSLFSTKQMKVMLLSRPNAQSALRGDGPFEAFGPLEFRVLYQFGELQLLGQVDFPDQFAWLVQDCARNRYTLLFTAGQDGGQAVHCLSQTHPLEKLSNMVPDISFLAAGNPQGERYIVKHRLMFQ